MPPRGLHATTAVIEVEAPRQARQCTVSVTVPHVQVGVIIVTCSKSWLELGGPTRPSPRGQTTSLHSSWSRTVVMVVWSLSLFSLPSFALPLPSLPFPPCPPSFSFPPCHSLFALPSCLPPCPALPCPPLHALPSCLSSLPFLLALPLSLIHISEPTRR